MAQSLPPYPPFECQSEGKGLLIRVKSLVKESKLIEKSTSTNNEVQSGHPTASCMLGAAWWSAAWATRREKVRPMHDKALSWRGSPVCPRCLFFAHRIVVRRWAIITTAPKIFHLKRQTQHVRHTIPYRLYHHYFFEHIKDRLMTSIVNQY